MDKRYSKRKNVFFVVFFVLLVFLLVWVFTAEGPEGNYYAYVFGYSATITMIDREVAEAFVAEGYEVKAPGIYLVNKEGKVVTPIRGGSGMVVNGVLSGDGREISVGLRGLRVGIKHSPVGKAVLIILLLLMSSLIAYRFIRSRRAVNNG
jgi:hypothetical protein